MWFRCVTMLKNASKQILYIVVVLLSLLQEHYYRNYNAIAKQMICKMYLIR